MRSATKIPKPAAGWFRSVPCFVLATLLPAWLVAGTPKSQPASPSTRSKPSAPLRKIFDCGAGITLRLSAASATPGSLILAEVRSTHPLTEVTADWDGRSSPFWVQLQTDRRRGDVRRALLGVDLEKVPGPYQMKIIMRAPTGDPVSCTAPIIVKKANFATERLKVASKFVEPNPEEAQQAAQEGEHLRAIFDHVTPQPLWQGNFRLPLDGSPKGSNFGRRRVLNGTPRSPHGGVDFPAPVGAPVRAAQRGRVVLAQPLFFPGNTVILDHGLGVYTLYGHLSAIEAQEGDLVEAGAEIGKVGATGRVTGPHLHWGLTVNRARVNGLEIVRLLGSPSAAHTPKIAHK